MRSFIWMGFLLLAPLGTAMGQHTNGYVFAGVSSVGTTAFTYWHGNYVHVGGGGELSLGSRFTIGGEVGELLSTAAFNTRNTTLVSVGPAFHFLRGDSRIDPFLTAGGTLLAGNGIGGMWFLGGGANLWFHKHIGVRLEFRRHMWTPESGEHVNFTGGRIGISFR